MMGRSEEAHAGVGVASSPIRRGMVAAASAALAATLAGCYLSGDLGGGSAYDSNLNGNGNGGSPTGTLLDPRGDGLGLGYDVIDEACEDVLDPAYLKRFETPMFRGVAPVAGVAHLVDGHRLWSVSVVDPAHPRRLSLEVLSGHPMKIAGDTGKRLYVAAGEAGLHVLQARDATAMAASAETGDASAVAPRLVSTVSVPGVAMDVALLELPGTEDASAVGDASGLEPHRYAVLAAGGAGVVVVDASDLAAPEVVASLPLHAFASAVALDGALAWVAACRSLVAVDLSDPRAPVLLGAYRVPLGHARGIFVEEGQVLVAGGEGLFVYDGRTPASLRWTGFYAEPEVPGFYVNDVVVRDGIAYLAAGDEAVRSVDLRQVVFDGGVVAPVSTYSGEPGLEEPMPLPPASLRPGAEPEVVESRPTDPIAVGLMDDLLLVLGNFRWLGERTLRVMQIDGTGRMIDVTAYVQPNEVIGVSALPGGIIAHGGGGVETLLPGNGASPYRFALPAPASRWVADDAGLWVLTTEGELLRFEMAGRTLISVGPASLSGFDLAVKPGDSGVYVSDRTTNQVVRLDPTDPLASSPSIDLLDVAFPGYAYLTVFGNRLYAYDGVDGLLTAEPMPGLPTSPLRVGLCEAYDVSDYYSGRDESRVRFVSDGRRLFMLCPHDERGGSAVLEIQLSRHAMPALVGVVPLPPACYTDFLVEPEGVVALSFDNNRYESMLSRHTTEEVLVTTFTGAGLGLARASGLLYVAAGEGGLRLYAPGDPDPWQTLGTLPVGQEE